MAKVVVTPGDDADFINAVLGQDDLAVVVRSHIHVENRLLHFIGLACPSPAHLKKMDLDFFQQVHLAMALGLPKDCGPPLLALGNMRNVFAHKLSASLTKDRADSLYKAFSAKDREIVQATYSRLKASSAGAKRPALRALEPKEQFIFYATSLRSMIQAHILLLRPRAE